MKMEKFVTIFIKIKLFQIIKYFDYKDPQHNKYYNINKNNIYFIFHSFIKITKIFISNSFLSFLNKFFNIHMIKIIKKFRKKFENMKSNHIPKKDPFHLEP